jgi:arachidonate 15-lipoxygenase
MRLSLEPVLPQHDDDPRDRAESLEEARRTYRYTYEWPPGVATAEDVPLGDGFSVEYLARLVPSAWELFSNTLLLTEHVVRHAELQTLFDLEKEKVLRISPAKVGGWYLGLAATLANYVTSTPVRDLSAYCSLHQAMPPPVMHHHWDDDLLFARQRVAGVNPMTLRRVESLPAYIRITDAHARASGALDVPLARALIEGRVFACDYTALMDVIPGKTFGRGKSLPAPYALFAAVGGALRPLAIQLGPGRTDAIVTPDRGSAWRVARFAVQVADANVHEASEHLARTHMVMGAVTLAMHRQLSSAHPLFKLLEPHTEFTLAINHSAATDLIAPGGVVDHAFGGHIESTARLVRASLDAFDLRASVPRSALHARGVTDETVLRDFPYRDDALRVYSAIERFVREYVELYYGADGDVDEDRELQAFARELGAHDGGRIPGVGATHTVDALVELLAVIVWTATGQHAAVNFPQYSFMGSVPNMAGACWGDWPPPDLDADDAMLSLMPPYNIAMSQVYTVRQLCSLRMNALGEYPLLHFKHLPARKVVAQFEHDLREVEQAISAREAPLPEGLQYPYLRPSRIPMSVHI